MSPYRPRRTAKAVAIRCGIVGMATHSVEAHRGITPTIAHASTGPVHGLPRMRALFEKVPLRHPRLSYKPARGLRLRHGSCQTEVKTPCRFAAGGRMPARPRRTVAVMQNGR